MKSPQMLVVLLALAIGAGAQQPSAKDNASGAFEQQVAGRRMEATPVEGRNEKSAPITFRLAPAMALSGVFVIILEFAAGLVRG